MRRNGKTVRLLALCLAAATLLLCAPASAGSSVSFPDVSSDDWSYTYIMLCASYGIIDGREDGLFHPKDALKRGEFLKLVCFIGEVIPMSTSTVHWADPYWRALRDAGVLWGLDLAELQEGQVAAALERSITRYEMSVIIRNLCFNVFGENAVQLDAPESRISDYAEIDSKYYEAVEQAFGKGILDGFSDGSFRGDDTMTREQAAAVVVRAAWPAQRKAVSFAEEIESATGGTGILDPEDSFSFRYRNMSTAERQLALFGDAGKSYFTGNEANLSDYIVTVEVPTWYLNPDGTKTTKVRTIQVHRLVADEVRAIFQEIYDDPERFPIKALGGARFTDSLRHSWGCAIDINPVENYYVNTTTWTALTGSTCYKFSDSPYCIRPGSSVVRAFAKYGWGWGGGTEANGYTGWNTTADYMHFSILSSGG